MLRIGTFVNINGDDEDDDDGDDDDDDDEDELWAVSYQFYLHAGGEDLVLFIQIKYLYEVKS